ncbi:CYFA0S01e19284g1_1 [Cyberlindnera fabianii]|uniref:CYFA0S01e19284g1_1 n=1 Tax=Cyberlindnera fabianii TaxID=36022 RepID=A0A061ARF7_CYBFA|nr:CYFA0S01e19284g1_1 [Cyberlindnera fabianii]
MPQRYRESDTTADSVHSTRSVVSINRDAYDYLAKVIIVGPSSTGKTCLLHRFVKGDFPGHSAQTIGVEFSSRVLIVAGDVPFKLQLWDTAGQERFRSLTRSYYRGSAGIVLVFDMTDKTTLYRLREHWQDARALARDPSAVIVGNKTDMVSSSDPSVVSDEEVTEFLSSLEGGEDIRYVKTSATTGENVDQVFQVIAEAILAKIEFGVIDPENQSFGVQYGDIPNWGATISSKSFQGKQGKVVRRKATTLSLVERTVEDNNSMCFC